MDQLTDAAGGEVRCHAQSSSFTEIAKGGVCRKRLGGKPFPRAGKSVWAKPVRKGASFECWDAVCPPAIPLWPPLVPNYVSQS